MLRRPERRPSHRPRCGAPEIRVATVAHALPSDRIFGHTLDQYVRNGALPQFNFSHDRLPILCRDDADLRKANYVADMFDHLPSRYNEM